DIDVPPVLVPTQAHDALERLAREGGQLLCREQRELGGAQPLALRPTATVGAALILCALILCTLILCALILCALILCTLARRAGRRSLAGGRLVGRGLACGRLLRRGRPRG